MTRLTSTLLPFLLVALLALYVNDVEAKTCKNKSHKSIAKTHDKEAKPHHSHKSDHKKATHHKAAPKPKPSHHHTQHKSHHSKPAPKKGKGISTTPPRGKAGVAGGQSLKWTGKDLAWFYDWSPNPKAEGDSNLEAVTMLWGLGYTSQDSDHDSERLAAFKKIKPGSYKYVMGMNEPDFQGGGSSGYIAPKDAAKQWDKLIGPHQDAGSILISPSMAKQKDEDWMQPFLDAVEHKPDAIAVHIFQNDVSKVGPVLDHFAQYNLPMWVTEFACINYQNGANDPCNQADTDTFISKTVDLLEADDRVAAYSVSDAYNGPVSALTPNHDGSSLSKTGNTFKQAVAKFAAGRRSLDSVDHTARMARRNVAHRRHAAHVASEQ